MATASDERDDDDSLGAMMKLPTRMYVKLVIHKEGRKHAIVAKEATDTFVENKSGYGDDKEYTRVAIRNRGLTLDRYRR